MFNLRSGSIFVSLVDLSRGRAKRKVESDTSLLRSVYRPLFSLIDFFQNWPIKITSATCYSRVLAREVKRIEEDIFVLWTSVPHDSLLLGILVVLVLKEALFTNFMNTGKGVMCFQKPMWWWYRFWGYEAKLMNLRLIEGRSVVDAFTLYAYIHVSLQITLLHVFSSKYNGKEIFCEESRVWVVDKRVFPLSYLHF